MELLIHISINLIALASIYVLFSIRLNLALKKAPRQALIRELRENIETAIEFINSSLELIDSKNRTFYRLLRRSEELARRLDDSVPLREDGAIIPSKDEHAMSTMSESSRSGLLGETGETGETGESSAAMRVFEKMQPDRVEIATTEESASQIFSRDERSYRTMDTDFRISENEASQVAKDSRVFSFLNKTGSYMRRWLGLAPIESTPSIETPTSGLKTQYAFDSENVKVSKDSSRTSVSGDNFQAILEEAVIEEQIKHDPIDLSTLLREEGYEVLPRSGKPRRRLLHRMLLRGFSPKEIAAKTGAGLAEIELTHALKGKRNPIEESNDLRA